MTEPTTQPDAHPTPDYRDWEVNVGRDGEIRLTHNRCDMTYPWDGPIPLWELTDTVREHFDLGRCKAQRV